MNLRDLHHDTQALFHLQHSPKECPFIFFSDESSIKFYLLQEKENQFMYKDIISYELAENVSKEQLVEIAEKIVTTWMKKQKGFIKWEIHSSKNGLFTDIVHWESEEDAKNAEKEMIHIPDAKAWYSCYKEGSISSKNISLIIKF